MRYDPDARYRRRAPRGVRGDAEEFGEILGRDEYGEAYEAPYGAVFHGYGLGYGGGALRSRGSYGAGQLRSGLNPRDEFEFEWGGGYVGGRGYGGTNYDLRHGYRVGAIPRRGRPRGESERLGERLPAMRGGAAAGERMPPPREPGPGAGAELDYTTALFGPARYGYGPYYERLRRRRRSDDEIREDVEETLFYDTWVDADSIEVEVDDGVVTLRGTLPNYDEVRYATDDAWDVDGVRGVRTELAVGSREPGAGEEQAAGQRGEGGDIGEQAAGGGEQGGEAGEG